MAKSAPRTVDEFREGLTQLVRENKNQEILDYARQHFAGFRDDLSEDEFEEICCGTLESARMAVAMDAA